jgi:hypothetical protein
MSSSVADTPVDLRCPVGRLHGESGAGGLLARLVLNGERPSFVQPDNLIEMACADCRTRLRGEGRTAVRRVLHRYDFGGSLVETLVVEDE